MILDPISAYLDGTDSHNNADVRGVLAPLARLADEYNVALIGVQHLNKGGQANALYRVTGSLAFTAAARAAWLIAKDKDERSRRLMLPLKMNLAADIGGLSYNVIESQGVAVIEWEVGKIFTTADEALAPDAPEDDERTMARDDAAAWLPALLAKGPLPVEKIEQESGAARFSWATVKRAKPITPAESIKHGFGGEGVWCWQLREDAQPPPARETSEHLREDGEHLSEAPHKDAQPPEMAPKMLNSGEPEHLSCNPHSDAISDPSDPLRCSPPGVAGNGEHLSQDGHPPSHADRVVAVREKIRVAVEEGRRAPPPPARIRVPASDYSEEYHAKLAEFGCRPSEDGMFDVTELATALTAWLNEQKQNMARTWKDWHRDQ